MTGFLAGQHFRLGRILTAPVALTPSTCLGVHDITDGARPAVVTVDLACNAPGLTPLDKESIPRGTLMAPHAIAR